MFFQSFNLIYCYRFTVHAVNGPNPINPVEANSSPSHINATKGSSVWLHWNYTYVGDGRDGRFVTFTYKEQVIGFTSTSQRTIYTVANKTGENGTLALELPTYAPFTGRVEVISSNSTFVIHGLQYNDSNYQFLSMIEVFIRIPGGSPSSSIFNLAPTVSITVKGMTIKLCLLCCFATCSIDLSICRIDLCFI